jgi:hypothetical protein
VTQPHDDFVARVERWLDEDGPSVAPLDLVESATVAPPQARRGLWLAMGAVLGAAAVFIIAALGSLLVQNSRVGPSVAPSTVATCVPGPPTCILPLPEGALYRSTAFRPVVTFIPGGDGWTATIDEPGRLRIEEIADPRRQVTFYTDPRAVEPEGGTLVQGIGPSVPELAAWLASHPMLDAQEPEPVQLAGVDGLRIDLRGRPDLLTRSTACQEPGIPCMSVLQTSTGSEAELGLLSNDHAILYLLELDGRVVVVSVEAIHGPSEEGFAERVAPILESLEFP